MRKAAISILLIITLFAAAACKDKAEVKPDPIQIRFTFVETQGVEAKGVNETAYDVEAEAGITDVELVKESIDNLYWTYKAAKKDSLGTLGDTGGSFVSLIEGSAGKGVDRELSFDIGSWVFEVKGYASSTDRASGSNVVFKGETGLLSISKSKTVTVPVTFVSKNSVAKATFKIQTSIEQDELKGMGKYKITRIVAKAQPSNNPEKVYTATLKDDGTGLFTGVITKMPYCVTCILSYDIYVDNEPFPRATAEEQVSTMSELETIVTGTAKVRVKEGKGIDIKLDVKVDEKIDLEKLGGATIDTSPEGEKTEAPAERSKEKTN